MWGSGDSSINQRLLLDMAECTDSGGNPLFDNRIVSIWEEERKHVWCLQDPERVALYTVTGHITNAGWSCQCSVVQEVLPHWNHFTCTWPAM